MRNGTKIFFLYELFWVVFLTALTNIFIHLICIRIQATAQTTAYRTAPPAQEDRTDGLSGSVPSDGGEVGILGRNRVVKGEDKPPAPSLPGLDFSSEKGRKLIGY